MPIKKTAYRGKHAIKTLIIVGSVGLVAVVLSLIIGLAFAGTVNTTYFGFALTFMLVNAAFAAYFGFVARRNKALYLASIITLFVASEILGPIGILTDTLLLIHVGWLLPITLFFYVLGEIYNDGSINARFIGAIAAAVVGTLILVWPAIDTSGRTAGRIIGIIVYIAAAALMLGYFIAFLVSYSRKVKKETLDLGGSKFAYDVPTTDESVLDSRANTTEIKELAEIPNIYEGPVWRIDDNGIQNIATYIHNYINECVSTINYMLSLAKSRISSVEDYNDFVKQYNTWIDNLNDDQEKMIDFLKKIANSYFLELDYGTCIEFNFYSYEIKREYGEEEGKFFVRFSGFSRTFHHPKAAFGKDKVEFSISSEYWNITKAGYHTKKEDSMANEHGYHLPGTPMPEED